MTKSALDLHGSVPSKSKTVLLVLDMFSDFRFENGSQAATVAGKIAPAIARLKDRCRRARIPTIYVNDNEGRWRSDFESILARCVSAGGNARKIERCLRPRPVDYCVLKPKHSGFFATPLDTLLQYFGAETLILTGMAAQQCVLLTACDAYVRDYRLWIPRDCIGALTTAEERFASYFLHTVLRADLAPSRARKMTALI
jgi:nicotinamidase-related amidase